MISDSWKDNSVIVKVNSNVILNSSLTRFSVDKEKA